MTDVLVIGAGPAGLSAAIELRSRGLEVTVADDQPAPGGRIFAAIERRQAHGAEDRSGAEMVKRFRAAGGRYLPAAEVWQIEPGPRVFLTQDGRARMLETHYVLLTTGAQERPMPFPGWEKPGVMTVGSAQILLKTASQVPAGPVLLAGTGPLLLLYAHQLLAAGGTIAGILDTAPRGGLSRAARLFPGAIGHGWRDLIRGLAWLREMSRVRVVRDVGTLEAIGADGLEAVRYTTRSGAAGEIPARLLLVHDGVVPSIHATMALACVHRWNEAQQCFEPVLDRFGGTSVPGVYVAGDGATIGGAAAAAVSGRLAAIGIACAAGAIPVEAVEAEAALLRRRLAAASRFRRFIDTLYPPSALLIPANTLVCRCEEVTAGRIREELSGRPHLDPDGVKIATRAGMGPCQGRQCGLSLTRLVAEAHGREPGKVGFLGIRPPLKPLTLGELAGLETA